MNYTRTNRAPRLAAITIAVVLIAALLSNSVSAMALTAAERKSAFFNNYGFTITNKYTNIWNDVYVMDVLESAFKKYPANLIKEMTTFYRDNGIKSTIAMLPPSNDNVEGEFVPDFANGAIVLNLYRNNSSNNSNIELTHTILHEVAHYLFLYLADNYAMQNGISLNSDTEALLAKQFTKDAGSPRYLGDNWIARAMTTAQTQAFVSQYAMYDAYEDFAELTTYMLLHTTVIRAILSDHPGYPIAKKVKIVEGYFEKYSKSITGANINWWYAAAQTSTTTAQPTRSIVYVDGVRISFDAFNINGSNYFKLRDLAFALRDSEAPFELGYNSATQAVTILYGDYYTAVGGELTPGDGKSKNALESQSKIYMDGELLDLKAYNIGGYNYIKLRDLASAVDIGVTFDSETNSIFIDSSEYYAAA